MTSESPPSESVTLVVVHWNNPEDLAKTLDSLSSSTLRPDVLVVDNASSPSKRAELDRLVDGSNLTIEILDAPANLGFGPGANVGLRHWLSQRGGNWVGVMPHDVIVDPDTLRMLIDEVRLRPAAGLVCADVGDNSRPIIDDYFGGMVTPKAVSQGWEPADYPHGTLMLASRACLSDIGLFDERFYAYVEEADLGLRASRRGWQIGIVHGATVENLYMSPDSGARDYLKQRNTIVFVRESFGRWHGTMRFVISVLHLLDGFIRPNRVRESFVTRARFMALRDALVGRMGPPPRSLRM